MLLLKHLSDKKSHLRLLFKKELNITLNKRTNQTESYC